MNEEQNNFNSLGNNGVPNNQPLNNQMMGGEQSINSQFQQIQNFQEPISQMNIEQPMSQSVNMDKPPRKTNLGLIIGIVVAVVVVIIGIVIGVFVFSSSSKNTKIEKLSVDLEKFEFTCENNSECNNLENHIIAIYPYKGSTSLTDYLYNALLIIDDSLKVYFSDQGFKEITELDGKVDISKITEIFSSGINSSNLVFGTDNKYYQITYGGKVEKVINQWDLKKFASLNEDYVSGIDESGKYVVYVKCSKYKNHLGSDRCPSDDVWVQLTPEQNSFVDWEFKDINSSAFLTNDNKLYSNSLYNFVSFKFDDLTFKLTYVNDTEKYDDSVEAENVNNMWYWNKDTHGWYSCLIVQMKDNNVRRYTTIGSKYDLISFDKEIKNVYFTNGSDNYIFETTSGYYFVEEENDTLVTKELTSLKKYQKYIRGFTIIYGRLYVLLSDGNLYKLDEVDLIV